ncbi:MAG: cyanophycinase [Methylotenera sp.]|nr:cyanophycinase [Oligoflexia bacterium]
MKSILHIWVLTTTVGSLLFAAPAFSAGIAGQKLMLVGGGKRPPAAVKKWVEWTRAYAAQNSLPPKILVIAWSSTIPEEVFEDLKGDLIRGGASDVISSLRPAVPGTPTFEADRKLLLEQIAQCSGVFWAGGDQNKHKKGTEDPAIHAAIDEAYWVRNLPMAGTSAGCTLMSEKMIIGNAPGITEGLGFLPETVIDMHFLKRKRTGRLLEDLKLAPPGYLGIGVDEDGSILFESRFDSSGKRQFEGVVVGDKKVMIIEGRTRISLLEPDQAIQWIPESHTVHHDCDRLLRPEH